jgi:hypothetical protein
LEQYIEELRKEYLHYYERAEASHYYLWHFLSLASLLASIATSVLAAFIKDGAFAGSPKYWLIGLPLVSSAISGFLGLFRIREMEYVRECGRIQMDYLIRVAVGDMTAAKTEEECHSIYVNLCKAVKRLEQERHEAHCATITPAVKKGEQPKLLQNENV